MYKSMAAEELATYSQDMFFIYSFRGWWVKFLTVSYDGKYPINNIISFLFYIITNFSILNSCYLLL